MEVFASPAQAPVSLVFLQIVATVLLALLTAIFTLEIAWLLVLISSILTVQAEAARPAKVYVSCVLQSRHAYLA